VAAVLLAALAASAGTPIDRRVAAKADGTVRIENLAGSVKITGAEGSEVVVTGELGDGVEELRVESQGGDVVIEVVYPRNAQDVEETDLVIQLPKRSRLDVETVSAKIEVRGVSGGQTLESVSGAIDVDAAGVKELEAKTVSGAIRVRDANGELEALSVSGAIRFDDCGGTLDAETTSGGMVVTGGSYTKAEVTTLSGGIQLSTDLAGKGEYKVESFSGAVSVEIPEDESARFAIDTYSGPIASEFDARVEKHHGSTKHCEVVLGDGSADVVIKSFSGAVSVAKQAK
jgi:DUF4097 and DUF4098 domain-containing protein YvlB